MITEKERTDDTAETAIQSNLAERKLILDLDARSLRLLPRSISQLGSHLLYLCLSDNCLQTLPREIGQLTKLVLLDSPRMFCNPTLTMILFVYP
jgi:hypothetical protein